MRSFVCAYRKAVISGRRDQSTVAARSTTRMRETCALSWSQVVKLARIREWMPIVPTQRPIRLITVAVPPATIELIRIRHQPAFLEGIASEECYRGRLSGELPSSLQGRTSKTHILADHGNLPEVAANHMHLYVLTNHSLPTAPPKLVNESGLKRRW